MSGGSAYSSREPRGLVSARERHQVEQQSTHIVSLDLGRSNSIANLFPEKANAEPGYHVKDKIENKLYKLVCAGEMSLRAVLRGIARNWVKLSRTSTGRKP